MTRYSPARIIGVTLGLSVAGIVCGGIAGAVAFAIALAITVGPFALGHVGMYFVSGSFGAALGAICAPLAGWMLLRDVPLGRAFVGLTIGTVIGGLVGWFFPITFSMLIQPIVVAACGFLVAAVVLRLQHARPGGGSRQCR